MSAFFAGRERRGLQGNAAASGFGVGIGVSLIDSALSAIAFNGRRARKRDRIWDGTGWADAEKFFAWGSGAVMSLFCEGLRLWAVANRRDIRLLDSRLHFVTSTSFAATKVFAPPSFDTMGSYRQTVSACGCIPRRGSTI